MINLQNDLQDFQDTQFPAFPVVFRQQLDQNDLNLDPAKSSPKVKPAFKLPQTSIKQLQLVIDKQHNTVYPQFFKQSWQNDASTIDNFFRTYRPLNEQFIQQMHKIKQNLKIVRLSANKIYVGEFKENKCSGMSVVVFKNGNIYQGHMLENKREGKGVYLESGSGWYEGSFVNNQKSQQGIEVLYNKWAYKGQFSGGLRNQKGLFVDKNELVYQGEWRLGIMHGKGTVRNANSTYQGYMVNSLKHGNGEQRFKNGDSYKGEYQNNRFDGFGTYIWKNGEASYQGSFKNGLRHGKGKWSGGQTKYSGSYVQGLKQGYGQLYFPSGNFYKGNFIQDKRQGYGQMFWTDGSFYKGDWNTGNQNGKGQLYIVGGEVISGIFENSILVQITPSIYEKQMQISSMGIHDLFGSNPQLENQNIQKQRTRNYSQSKGFNVRKKLAKIDEGRNKKASIKDNMYFKPSSNTRNSTNNNAHNHSHNHEMHQHVRHNHHFDDGPHGSAQHSHTPNKRNSVWTNLSQGKSSDGQTCKCMVRLQKFRLRQRIKTKMGDSKVQNTLSNQK